jgi:DNA-binding FadR family transcriptional regulator
MTEELALLVDRIDALIADRETASSRALLAELEHTLTDGYARALELEAARFRMEREVTDLATRLATPAEAESLRELVAALARADRELGQLRTRLQMLRRRTDGVRAALADASAYLPASNAASS